MSAFYFQSELLNRFVVMVTLTLAFGGLGLFITAPLPDNKISSQLLEQVVKAIAVGLATTVLITISLSALGILLTKTNLLIAFLLLYGASIFRIVLRLSKSRIQLRSFTRRELIEILAVVSLFLVVLVIRLAQINGVLVPNWFDGLTHTSLLQRFTINAEIPFDYIYHVGFHSIALIVYSLWGLSPPETILLLGQWLGAVCGLTFYIFVRRFIHNAYCSGLSLIVYYFFLLFPAYLVSIGRYPFLLGLTLLPPAILASRDWLNTPNGNFLSAFIIVTSLALSHYGAFLIWFSFVLTYITNQMILKKFNPETIKNGKVILQRLIVLIIPPALLILPKLLNLMSRPDIVGNLFSRTSDLEFRLDTLHAMELVHTHDYFFVFLWIICIQLYFVYKRKLLYIILSWPLVILFLTWIQYQTLGLSVSTYANLIIFLSIPLAFSFGLLSRELLLVLTKAFRSPYPPFSRKLLHSLMSILMIVFLLAGIFSSPRSIDQEKSLFTSEDALAMKWITENTPKDSGFLIRTIIWGNNALAPSDGGGWINALTGRRTVIPKMGELYDICVFAKNNSVDYVYFGRQIYNQSFDLRLSELDNENHAVIYKNPSVEIVSLHCP